MDHINQERYLAELDRLLGFMSSWDRQAALKKYRAMFAACADEQALIDFIQDNGRVELNQMQPMDGPTLQLAMSPIEDPDDYCVAFLYVTTDGEVKCTGPLPLSDYS